MNVSTKIPPVVARRTAPYPNLPVRQYSFTDHSVNHPTEPQPGNRLDSEFTRTNNAITQVLGWATVSLNTDGTLRPGSVGPQQIASGIFDFLADDARAEIQPLVDQAHLYTMRVTDLATEADRHSTIAKTAALAASDISIRVHAAIGDVVRAAEDVRVAAKLAEISALDAGNDARSTAGDVAICTDYGILTQAWAEHMPDTIPPNILAVMGVTGDHWSSRWWANHAAEQVSGALDDLDQALNDALDQINTAGDYWLGVLEDQTENAIQGIQSLYLGAFWAPPAADSLGNPIATGALYFDLSLDAAFVWNGTAWRPLITPSPSAIFRYIYVATAGQTTFSGADRSGNVFQYNSANYQTLEVFKAGLLLTPTNDYTETLNSVTLTSGATVGQIVQLLVASVPKISLDWKTIRLDTSAWTSSGGVLRDISNGTAVTPQSPSDVMVSVDGVWQEGVRDYAIAGNLLTFTTPTLVNARVFGLVIIPTQTPTVPTPGLTVLDTSTWIFNGVTTAFALRNMSAAPVTPADAVHLLISLNGVWQAAISDYTVAGSTVTFTTPPQTASIVFAVSGMPA